MKPDSSYAGNKRHCQTRPPAASETAANAPHTHCTYPRQPKRVVLRSRRQVWTQAQQQQAPCLQCQPHGLNTLRFGELRLARALALKGRCEGLADAVGGMQKLIAANAGGGESGSSSQGLVVQLQQLCRVGRRRRRSSTLEIRQQLYSVVALSLLRRDAQQVNAFGHDPHERHCELERRNQRPSLRRRTHASRVLVSSVQELVVLRLFLLPLTGVSPQQG